MEGVSPRPHALGDTDPFQNPKSGIFLSKIEVDFPLARKKIALNGKRKRFLVKLYQERAQAKSERILKLRKDKLDRYKINYIPLCADEDWEMIAAFYAKNSEKS